MYGRDEQEHCCKLFENSPLNYIPSYVIHAVNQSICGHNGNNRKLLLKRLRRIQFDFNNITTHKFCVFLRGEEDTNCGWWVWIASKKFKDFTTWYISKTSKLFQLIKRNLKQLYGDGEIRMKCERGLQEWRWFFNHHTAFWQNWPPPCIVENSPTPLHWRKHFQLLNPPIYAENANGPWSKCINTSKNGKKIVCESVWGIFGINCYLLNKLIKILPPHLQSKKAKKIDAK